MRNLEYTTIQSPVDGVVVKRLVNIGQTVVSSMSASSLFYIATDLSKLKIWAAVNEADIGSIRKGQEVLFTVDAFSGRKFKGTVDKIRLDATMTSNVVTYIVDIDVPNPDKLLIPYLTANVQFVVEDIRTPSSSPTPRSASVRKRNWSAPSRRRPLNGCSRNWPLPPKTARRKKPWSGNCGTIFFTPTWSPGGKQRHADGHHGRNAPGRHGNRLHGADTEPLRQLGRTELPPPPAGKIRSRPRCRRAASRARATRRLPPPPATAAAPASLIRGNASIHPLNHSFLPLQALQQRDPLT